MPLTFPAPTRLALLATCCSPAKALRALYAGYQVLVVDDTAWGLPGAGLPGTPERWGPERIRLARDLGVQVAPLPQVTGARRDLLRLVESLAPVQDIPPFLQAERDATVARVAGLLNPP